ncbi:MAG: hypothetical protein MZV70_11700 [Desulfobacterales bacterium]|nr:hypothetical protein [Desulfobacterales bacterium]
MSLGRQRGHREGRHRRWPRCVIAQVNARHAPRPWRCLHPHRARSITSFPTTNRSWSTSPEPDTEIAQPIGKYVARLIEDGDTIQVGYGSIPNAILAAPCRQEAPGHPHGASQRRHRRTDAGKASSTTP